MPTEEQTKKYFETQSGQAEPLSPLAFLSSEMGEDIVRKKTKVKEQLTPQEYLEQGGALRNGQIPTERIESEKTGGGMTHDEMLGLYEDDQRGITKLDDGTYDADDDAKERIGITIDPLEEEITASKQRVATARTDIDAAQDRLRNLDISKDPSFIAISTGIQSQWQNRIVNMEKTNRSREAQMSQLGIRLGSKFTGGSFQTIILEEERQGLERVGRLESQKAAALANAEVAFRANEWEKYVFEIELAEEHYKKEVEELNALNELAIKQSELQRDTQITNSILDMIGAGYTDPIEIMRALGGTADIKTITALTDEIITASEETGLDVSQTTSDFQTFNYLQQTNQLPEGIKTYDEYVRRMAEVKRKPEIPKITDVPTAEIPTFDEFVDEILQTPIGEEIINNYQEQVRQTIMPDMRRQVVANEVKDLYDKAIEATTPKEKFSSTEKKKLEQAGLSNATRQEQLDFLYGKATSEFGFDDL